MLLGRPREITDVWQRWYAWHPVNLRDGRVAWLEWVERRTARGLWYYRAIGDTFDWWK